MKKKILSTALAFISSISICSFAPNSSITNVNFGIKAEAAADTIYKDGFTIETDSSGEKYIAKYTGSNTKVVIPGDVSYIGVNAFLFNDRIESVTFSKDFTGKIDEFAFWGCINLKTIVFEGNISDIGDYAFGCCIELEKVTFNEGIYSDDQYGWGGIGSNAFAYCNGLDTVEFKNPNATVGYVGKLAFYNCFDLTSINLPADTRYIRDYAFANCLELTKLTVPSKVIQIGTKAIGFPYVSTSYFDYNKTIMTISEINKNWEFDVFKESTTVFNYFCKEALVVDSKAQKEINLLVTKDSVGEKYAKDNKIIYDYVKETSSASNSTATTSEAKLSAPTGIKSSASTSKVTITWNTVDGADAYKVYMYDSATKKYKAYKTVSSAKCTVSGLKSGTTYKFKVAALDKINGKYVAGDTSKAVSTKTK